MADDNKSLAHLRAHGHSAGATWRAEARGRVRHRRERDHQRLREGSSAPATSQQIQIQGGSGLSDDEVQDMIRNAEAHADEAQPPARGRGHEEPRRDARVPDPSVPSRSTATRSTRPTPRRSRVGSWSSAPSLEGDDLGDIRAKTEALTEASHKLAEAMYAAGAAQAQASRRAATATRSDDEVVEDAEYEDVDQEVKTTRAKSRSRGAAREGEEPSGRRGDRLHRPAADFDNFRKRAARERASTSRSRTRGSSPELLPTSTISSGRSRRPSSTRRRSSRKAFASFTARSLRC